MSSPNAPLRFLGPALLGGALVAALGTLAAWILALTGLRSSPGLGVLRSLHGLLPLEAGLAALLAWLLHLRDDGFLRQPDPEAPPRDGTRGAQAILAVAALILLLVASLLYAFAGLGPASTS